MLFWLILIGLIVFIAIAIYLHRNEFFAHLKFIVWSVFLLPVVLFLLLLGLYCADYYSVQKAKEEHGVLRSNISPGMDRSEVLNKLEEYGYKLCGKYGGFRGTFETKNDEIKLYFKSATRPFIIFGIIDYYSGCRVALTYREGVTFCFDDDKLTAVN